MFLTWIASVDKKVEESRKLGVVVSGKFVYSGRFAPLPCTVYLVYSTPPPISNDFEPLDESRDLGLDS